MDVSTGEKLQINVDFTFPHMPCSRKLRHLALVVLSVHGAVLSLDVMDVSGEQHLDVDHNVFKKNIDNEGKQIGAIEKHGVCVLCESLLVTQRSQSCTTRTEAPSRN